MLNSASEHPSLQACRINHSKPGQARRALKTWCTAMQQECVYLLLQLAVRPAQRIWSNIALVLQGSASQYSSAPSAEKDTALRQSSRVLKYSFGFLAVTLLGGAVGGENL